jgi:hypothetical protein
LFLKSDIVSLKNTMSPKQKNINVIHNCEELFSNWLKVRLGEKGISINESDKLSELLICHGHELANFKQHLKPLVKWNKIKDECYDLSTRLNGIGKNDEQLVDLIEKTAFEGQILWLTLQED